MQAVVAKFRTFREAEEASREYYRRLSPVQCLEILFELRTWAQEGAPTGAHKEDDALSGRLARVYRIAELPRG